MNIKQFDIHEYQIKLFDIHEYQTVWYSLYSIILNTFHIIFNIIVLSNLKSLLTFSFSWISNSLIFVNIKLFDIREYQTVWFDIREYQTVRYSRISNCLIFTIFNNIKIKHISNSLIIVNIKQFDYREYLTII